jgi:hypothetical protein
MVSNIYRKAKARQVTMAAYEDSAGNIRGIEFVSKWPNGRDFRHGAMRIDFFFHPMSRISAEADVEALMESRGLDRGVDYHIPDWNFWGNSGVRKPFHITFNSDEDFVMAKMMWDLQ